MRKVFTLLGRVVVGVLISLMSGTMLLAADWNPLPDTGQTECFDYDDEIPCPAEIEPYHGQDAQYNGPVPSYSTQTINDDVIVIDNNTNLSWQQNTADTDSNGSITDGIYPVGDRVYWQQAIDYCLGINFAGYSDWRMPDLMELESILNYGRSYSPMIHPAFQCESDDYWSATSHEYWQTDAWLYSFNSGSDGWSSMTAYASATYVRCVRGGQTTTGPYTDNGDNTVTDQATGLTWQRQTADTNDDGSITPDPYPAGDLKTWQDALAWCEGSRLAGHSDWRLPNIRELKSLTDRSTYDPAIDPVFQCESDEYWSATTYEDTPIYAWSVIFDFGDDDRTYKGTSSTFHKFLRCVRGGLPELFDLSVSFAGSGSGVIIINPPYTECTSECSESYLPNTMVTLSASADYRSTFNGWTGECSGMGICQITMDEAKSITANFTFSGSTFFWPMFLPAIIGAEE